MGGVGRPNTSVSVGEEAEPGREEARPEAGPESVGDEMGLEEEWWWWR